MNSIKGSLLVAAGAVATIAGSQVVASADTTYAVKSGDTLYSIAARYNSSVNAIAQANGISNTNLILTGQNINIPGADSNTTNNNSNNSNNNNAGNTSSSASYTVVSGDTLYGIASKHGMTLASLVQLNNLNPAQVIFPGQVLNLSGNGSSTDSNSSANTDTNANTNSNSNQNNTVVDTTNTYPYGQCTWYVKSQLSWVGNYWGNASSWAASAVSAGHTVSSVPTAGSVAYFGPGVQGADATYGHVAVVDSVNANGTVNISEANYLGLIYHTRTISTSGLLFIHQ
ncbi:putative N-acetylmuramoyl-L-alanine amidase [Weissella oryzae SG25]|uniref:Putative N-acetylmuramoyl-L-alanine amidase n=1 Tax=Weissella oryzae (strain DSM 25784 / JCM 18191 / LMG 30913 / SG25) TaxID=1329250 RepID=A0A069CV96_WEIOS|nr:LysM peptidoglycan-binding domain-containing protein [Weissella oryzae]GAK31394.1 putative N-acetylmuramoyl-L-alanine amidase [Weissella oryzae SG25]